MLRALFIFLVVALIAVAAVWFADRPGQLTISWLGYEIETSFMLAVGVIVLAFFTIVAAWTVVRGIVGAPGLITNFFRTRRQARGLDALTRGVVAASAGDETAAERYATLAHRALGDTPLSQLLRAQAAQLSGDHATVRRVFNTMLENPETEVLALRGLFVQAQQDGELGKARHYAEKALKLNPRLNWAAQAMLVMQAASADWEGVERTIDDCRRNRLLTAEEANRKTAVALTARALLCEETATDQALDLALRAHKLAPELVPAAALAGRLLAGTGQPRKAVKVLEKSWRLSPHPDLAEIYGAAYTGRSPRERLKRVKNLVNKLPAEIEGPIAVARAAVEANEWEQARDALSPLLDGRPTVRVCQLMAEIAHGADADEGRAREWLSRAMYAPRDPAWVADGRISDRWLPCSPVTGVLDAFSWRVPEESLSRGGEEEQAAVLEDAATAGADAKADGEQETSSEARSGVPALAETDGGAATGEASEAASQDTAEEISDSDAKKGDAPAARAEPEAEKEPDTQAPESSDKEGSRVFVPPRAPDDPGPEPREEEGGNWFQALFAR